MKKKALFLILVLTCAYSIVSAGPIDGTVSGVVQEGVSITLTKVTCGQTSSETTETIGGGSYDFPDVENGDYLVTPERTGYTFSPKNRLVTISDNSVSGVDFTSAVARFVDNGDGTVTDTLTDLIWLKNANCVQTQDWNIASLFVLGLGAYNGGCGLSDGSEYGDWRLPTKAELQGIGTDPLTTWYSDYPSVTWTMPSEPFTNGGPGYWYWSNTENAANANYVWVLQMLSGYTNNSLKGGTLYVWPVRGAYTISGTVSGEVQSGVTVTLSGNASKTTATSVTGSYSFAGLSDGSYMVTPSKSGYTFNPTNESLTVSDNDETGVNFYAYCAKYPGSASGNIYGDRVGTWSASADNNGTITISVITGETFIGTISLSGYFSATGSYGSYISGYIDCFGNVSGNWRDTDGYSGTFSGAGTIYAN